MYEEKKANDAIVNAAVFRAGLKEWAKAEANSEAYLETWPKGADAPRIFLSLADLYGKRGQRTKELKQLEEYRQRFARDPEDWLAAQQRIAEVYERSGNRSAARRTYEEAYAYWRPRRERVKERGLGVVAQAMYLDLEPEFVEYDRVTLDVAPQFLKGQLQVKGKKLKKLEESYGQVVKLKQAEPAICALYRIGLGYRRFAQALHDAPVPREIRGKAALVEEYKAQIAQVSEPLEAKATEGFELAMNASRDYGVVNECARQATAYLLKAKPDRYGPSPEVVPEIASPAPTGSPQGYGILAGIQPVTAPARSTAVPRRAPRRRSRRSRCTTATAATARRAAPTTRRRARGRRGRGRAGHPEAREEEDHQGRRRRRGPACRATTTRIATYHPPGRRARLRRREATARARAAAPAPPPSAAPAAAGAAGRRRRGALRARAAALR